MTFSPKQAFAQAIEQFNAGNIAIAADRCIEVLAATGDSVEPLTLLAIVRATQRRLAEAADCYRRILAIDPSAAEVHENLGLVLSWQKQHAAALESFKRAAELRPDRAASHQNMGNAYLAMQRGPEAIACFRRAAAIDPRLAAAHFNIGVAASAMRRPQEAIASYRAALAIEPNFAEAHNNLGIALRAAEYEDEAIASFRRAIELRPDFAEACNNLGNALENAGDPAGAITAFRRAAALAPALAQAHYNLGAALARQKQYDEALPILRRAIEIDPELHEAHSALGHALLAVQRFEDAISSLRRATDLKPDLFVAHLNTARALLALQRYEAAVSAANIALSFEPDNPEAHSALGGALFMLERYDESLDNFRQTLAAVPDHPVANGTIAFLQRQMCDWSEMEQREAGLLDQVRADRVDVEPFIFLSITEDPALQLACARQHWKRVGIETAPSRPAIVKKHSKIRLGYYSGNFRTSATAFLTAQLYELHDRSRFEVVGVSYGPEEDDAMRRRLKGGFDRLIDLQHATDREIYRTIQEQEIDIVIDLKGYQKHSRMSVLAQRPAPVQVHYICHPGTLGVDFIDYAFVDRYLVPPEAEPYFTENLVFLPDTYLVSDQRRVIGAPPGRAACGLPEDGFVFCCFNNTYKITPQVFDVWMRLLKAVPGSVLWLIADNDWAEQSLRREAAARGVDPARIVFAPRMHLPQHLARHRHADLFIDTFPYCAHTTATDALWAGLPLLTLTGRSFASRVAASLLRASNLPELITQSIQDYESLALKLATDPALLARMKAKLSGDLTKLPAFDTQRLVRHIETAYERMWQRHLAGEAPQSFAVD